MVIEEENGMAECVNCGKTLNFFNEISPLWSETEEKLCSKCWDKSLCVTQKPSIKNYEECYTELLNEGFTEKGLKYLHDYCEYKENFRSIKEQRKREQEEEKERIKNHMLTTGYNFEGYAIKKYIKVLSGNVCLGTGFLSELSASFSDFFGEESNRFSDKLETAKNAATKKLIEQSVALGGNAIIGVDFDYIIFGNNMIGVVVNGTSVYIEPTEEH